MSFSPRTRTVIAIGFGQLLAWGSSYYLLAVLALPMAQGLGIPPLWVYLMFSGALIVAAALGPWAGARVDRLGGRTVLMLSNGVFAAAHLLLASAQDPVTLALGWLLLGAAMPLGLYDAGFATLVRLYHEDARRSIVGVTLIAGFASSVSWPLSAALEHHYSWRVACVAWALLHLSLGLAIHYFLIPSARGTPPVPARSEGEAAREPSTATFWILACVFTCSGFVFASLAAHLPRLLQAVGCTPAMAVAAASIVGATQVAGRLAEVGWLHRLHPLVLARISLGLHPLGALLLAVFGAPLAFIYTGLHGVGVGIITILKGTLPLALFGPQGFGKRSGQLEAPSRIAQAAAPVVFGLCLDSFGAQALWVTGLISLAGLGAALYLRRSAAS